MRIRFVSPSNKDIEVYPGSTRESTPQQYQDPIRSPWNGRDTGREPLTADRNAPIAGHIGGSRNHHIFKQTLLSYRGN
jgi:hypothetical protein